MSVSNPVPYRDTDTSWRSNARETERASVLMSLVPGGESVLDAGARDGYFSRLLADRYRSVTALDLEAPPVVHERVRSVAGDLTRLDFPDQSFDGVFCAEVLEHIPDMEKACKEIRRVARKHVIIGVPFEQDLRAGRVMCRECGRVYNAWKHVHSFTERRLVDLFAPLRPERISFAGKYVERTNFLSASLMRTARYPWGAYNCAEPCECGAIIRPPDATFTGKVCASIAVRLDRLQALFVAQQSDTINVLFTR
jgi:ubiquinone/menaquinone biosynthesis C-methylase UbiE